MIAEKKKEQVGWSWTGKVLRVWEAKEYAQNRKSKIRNSDYNRSMSKRVQPNSNKLMNRSGIFSKDCSWNEQNPTTGSGDMTPHRQMLDVFLSSIGCNQ